MAEPANVILPILQRIHADINATCARLDDIEEHLALNTEKTENIEGYMTYHLGVTSRHGVDIEVLKENIEEMKRRLSALEEHPR